MAKNSISDGVFINIIALSALTAGVPALIENMFVIPLTDIPVGSDGNVTATGVWELPKDAATTGNPLARVYWDNTNKVVTTTATGNRLIGCLTKEAVNGSTIAEVRLNGQAV